MIRTKTLVSLLFCALILWSGNAMAQKFSSLAQTPPMGWNSWNKFACEIDETLIKEMADAMVEKGLLNAGYEYLNLDDCWHGAVRDENEFIQADAKRFPSGMKALGDYIHSKGLKFGIYSDAGCETCGGRLGSLGHEYQDALQYARWGVDYLKYDWCKTENVNPVGAYTLIRDAIRKAGRPIVLSMCEWGHSKPWEWASEVGHLWRTTGDICLSYDGNVSQGDWTALGVLQILDLQVDLRKYAGPGHWNDPDMLEVGNGFTEAEDRSHFSMWCMLAAPLILGNDIRTMSDETLAIITNADAIAVNQDPMGVQALKHSANEGVEYWFKPLTDNRWAMAVLNRNTESRNVTIDWQRYNFTDDEVSKLSTNFDTKEYEIKNVWAKTNVKTKTKSKKTATTAKPINATVEGHDILMYILTPKK